MRCKINNKKFTGFTLIELVVGVTVFVIVISIVVNLFVLGLKGQRKFLAIQNVQDNARYLLEFIAKEIRMSTINNSASNSLNITRPDGEVVTYVFTGQTIDRLTANPSTTGPLNSNEVLISGGFYTTGIGLDDSQQPRVTIVMKIEATGEKKEQESEINIQTTLCPRNLEI